jgi:pimeloyl-ACP methyl ester carboxylesterase
MGGQILFVVGVGAAVLAGLVLLVRRYERAEMFKPAEGHAETPEGLGIPTPREIFIDSGGDKIHAWFFQTSPSAPTLMYVHGNAGNIADRLGQIKGYLKLGLNVFIYDPRGYGKSGGKPTPESFVEDAFTAHAYLTGEIGIDRSQIVVLGQSLGGDRKSVV